MMRSRPPSRRGGPRTGQPLRPRGAAAASRRLATPLGLTAAPACARGGLRSVRARFVFGAESCAARPGLRSVRDTTARVLGSASPRRYRHRRRTSAVAEQEASRIATTGTADPAVTASAGSLLVTLPWGSGEGQVGLARPVEGLTRGPEALAVAPDGRIAVLDSVNRRVLFLDAARPGDGYGSGAARRAALPRRRRRPALRARLRRRPAAGHARLERRRLWHAGRCPNLPDVVTGLFATSRGPCVEVAHDSVFLVARDGPGQGRGRPRGRHADSRRPTRPGLAPLARRAAGRALT